MRAIRQCNGLERLVALEQSPETLDTRPPFFLPGDVHIFEEEIPNPLGVRLAHKVVYEELKVLH
jgi:hypothetical protein